MALDPNDSRPAYQQVASQLRASILTGDLKAGDRLPTGGELATSYDVAKMTIQKALGRLKDEGLIVSRQGAGVFVKERSTKPTDLRSHLEEAFDNDLMQIDFAGFSGETLQSALIETLDKVRTGRYTPDKINIRILVPDSKTEWSLPCNVEDLSDNPEFRNRAQSIIERSSFAIVDAVEELSRLQLVPDAKAEVRTFSSVQHFKLYVINRKKAFFGFYPIAEHELRIADENHNVYDLMGKDAILFQQEVGPLGDELSTQYVNQSLKWFDSVWGTVARTAR